MLFDPQMRRSPVGRRHLIGDPALFRTELQRGHAVPVPRDVHIDRVFLEALPDHQHRFAVRVSAASDKGNIRGKCDVPTHLLPDELQLVLSKPHVLAASRNRVGSLGRVVFDRARMQRSPHVAAAFKHTEHSPWPLRLRAAGKDQENQNHQRSAFDSLNRFGVHVAIPIGAGFPRLVEQNSTNPAGRALQKTACARPPAANVRLAATWWCLSSVPVSVRHRKNLRRKQNDERSFRCSPDSGFGSRAFGIGRARFSRPRPAPRASAATTCTPTAGAFRRSLPAAKFTPSPNSTAAPAGPFGWSRRPYAVSNPCSAPGRSNHPGIWWSRFLSVLSRTKAGEGRSTAAGNRP